MSGTRPVAADAASRTSRGNPRTLPFNETSFIQLITSHVRAGAWEAAYQTYVDHQASFPNTARKRKVLQQLVQRQSSTNPLRYDPACAPDYTLSCFFVPTRAFTRPHLTTLKGLLERRGFDVLDVLSLPNGVGVPSDSAWFGPTRDSWGGVFVCMDLCPWTPTELECCAWPEVDNVRIFRVANIPRSNVMVEQHGALSNWSRLSMLGNTTAVRDWLSLIAPEALPQYMEAAENQSKRFKVRFPVERPLSRFAARARVDVVLTGEKLAVCKTFKPLRTRAFQNELAALQALKDVPYAPDLLEAGGNWILMSYMEDLSPVQDEGHLCDRDIVDSFKLLHDLHHRGFMHLDFHPGNVMKRGADVCLIDFEHCTTLPKKTPFSENPLFSTSLSLVECEIPTGGVPRFDSHWAPLTSLDQKTVLRRIDA